MGDYNTVRTSYGRLDGQGNDEHDANKFNDCLDEIDMEELVTKGFWFT